MIPFNDLRRQNELLAGELSSAISNVINSGWYILGEEVEAFEDDFADFLGIDHCIGVASGTDAIQLALMGLGIGHGDEVITAANTCVPTVAGISATGATPVLADVCGATLTLDADSVAHAITPRTRAIVPVHLYGHPCDMAALASTVHGKDIFIVEDCAQAHGTFYNDDLCGTLGHCAAFSYYPTKNLGALGDGGAVITDNADTAKRIRGLRQYGRAEGYDHPRPGINSRLDEMQAAVLRVKLQYLNDADELRREIASSYDDNIKNDYIALMKPAEWATTNHHLYVVRSPHRDALQQHLTTNGIHTQIHYPAPIHLLTAYRELGESGAFPVSERACEEVLSLPLYPGMPESHVDAVIDRVNKFRP